MPTCAIPGCHGGCNVFGRVSHQRTHSHHQPKKQVKSTPTSHKHPLASLEVGAGHRNISCSKVAVALKPQEPHLRKGGGTLSGANSTSCIPPQVALASLASSTLYFEIQQDFLCHERIIGPMWVNFICHAVNVHREQT